jgi:hypothetical protein
MIEHDTRRMHPHFDPCHPAAGAAGGRWRGDGAEQVEGPDWPSAGAAVPVSDNQFSPSRPFASEISGQEAAAAFAEHIVRKAAAARQRYGPCIGPDQIVTMLHDPEVVRYPTALEFDAAWLQPHEFGWPKPLGFHPRDGYCLFLHPCFRERRETWPLLIAYHIPVINYGAAVVEPSHAELFGAALLGMREEAYYGAVCQLADSIPHPGGAACRAAANGTIPR